MSSRRAQVLALQAASARMWVPLAGNVSVRSALALQMDRFGPREEALAILGEFIEPVRLDDAIVLIDPSELNASLAAAARDLSERLDRGAKRNAEILEGKP